MGVYRGWAKKMQSVTRGDEGGGGMGDYTDVGGYIRGFTERDTSVRVDLKSKHIQTCYTMSNAPNECLRAT